MSPVSGDNSSPLSLNNAHDLITHFMIDAVVLSDCVYWAMCYQYQYPIE